ncbi:MAG: NifB/NifX family molybdenum-iron cluster-binding protein [candidate division Zixibacteria bacterium]|nr:NifB/NifX family molybdenum-iron cluster-binding protein [candidate division Zixibacteria bacterium]
MTGEIKIMPNAGEHHRHGTCYPLLQLQSHHIDCVICPGIGRRAIMFFNQQDIKVFPANDDKVKQLIDSLKNQTLRELPSDHACRGHGGRMN